MTFKLKNDVFLKFNDIKIRSPPDALPKTLNA